MLRRPAILLALAVACAAATVALWLLANELPAGRRLDARIADALSNGFPRSLDDPFKGVSTLADTLPYAAGAAGLVTLAWLRRGAPLSLVVAFVLLGANVTAQLLQPALAGSRQTLWEVSSWPSGHATAAMVLGLCAVLIAGPRLRAITAAGAAGYALAVGAALIASRGHVASDVVAGYLVAALFAAAGAAVLARIWPTLAPARPRSPALAPVLGALAAGAVLATALGKAAVTRRDELLGAVGGVDELLAVAAAGLALAAALGLLLVLRSRN